MKKNCKSLIASVLAVAMIFALAACGSPAGTPSGSPAAPGKPGKTGSESTPAFVYVSSFREVKNENNRGIGTTCFTDKGFYTTPSEIVGHREHEEGAVEEYEGQFDITAEGLAFMTYDGKYTKLESYEPFVFVPPEGHDGTGEMRLLAADAQGNLAAVYHNWESWNEAPEGVSEESEEYWSYYRNKESWFLRTMDPTGRELSMTEIAVKEDDWFWPNNMILVDGKILLAGSDGLRIFNADGSGASKISMDGYIQSVLTLNDGTPCLVYSDNMTNETRLGAIDLKSGRVTQTWKCPRNAYNFFSGGGDYDLYYQSGINMYGYKLDSEEGEKLFDWLNVDVSQNNLSGFTVREDGSFFAVCNSWDSKGENVTTEFVTLEKKSFADVPQKKTLTLACQWVDSK